MAVKVNHPLGPLPTRRRTFATAVGSTEEHDWEGRLLLSETAETLPIIGSLGTYWNSPNPDCGLVEDLALGWTQLPPAPDFTPSRQVYKPARYFGRQNFVLRPARAVAILTYSSTGGGPATPDMLDAVQGSLAPFLADFDEQGIAVLAPLSNRLFPIEQMLPWDVTESVDFIFGGSPIPVAYRATTPEFWLGGEVLFVTEVYLNYATDTEVQEDVVTRESAAWEAIHPLFGKTKLVILHGGPDSGPDPERDAIYALTEGALGGMAGSLPDVEVVNLGRSADDTPKHDWLTGSLAAIVADFFDL